jgi:hypothetical protein
MASQSEPPGEEAARLCCCWNSLRLAAICARRVLRGVLGDFGTARGESRGGSASTTDWVSPRASSVDRKRDGFRGMLDVNVATVREDFLRFEVDTAFLKLGSG